MLVQLVDWKGIISEMACLIQSVNCWSVTSVSWRAVVLLCYWCCMVQALKVVLSAVSTCRKMELCQASQQMPTFKTGDVIFQ